MTTGGAVWTEQEEVGQLINTGSKTHSGPDKALQAVTEKIQPLGSADSVAKDEEPLGMEAGGAVWTEQEEVGRSIATGVKAHSGPDKAQGVIEEKQSSGSADSVAKDEVRIAESFEMETRKAEGTGQGEVGRSVKLGIAANSAPEKVENYNTYPYKANNRPNYPSLQDNDLQNRQSEEDVNEELQPFATTESVTEDELHVIEPLEIRKVGEIGTEREQVELPAEAEIRVTSVPDNIADLETFTCKISKRQDLPLHNDHNPAELSADAVPPSQNEESVVEEIQPSGSAVGVAKEDINITETLEMETGGAVYKKLSRGDSYDDSKGIFDSLTPDNVIINKEPLPPVHKLLSNDEIYKMSDGIRGRCLVINTNGYQTANKKYGKECNHADVTNLTALFRSLKFNVILKPNVNRSELIEVINDELENRKHLSSVMFVLTVLSDDVTFQGHSGQYYCEKLVEKIGNCDALTGKPKLIVIQPYSGHTTESHQEKPFAFDSNLPEDVIMIKPFGLDAIPKGQHGSPFIRTLVEELYEHAHEWDLEKICQQVENKTRYYNQSSISYWNNPNPSYISSLGKKLYFFPAVTKKEVKPMLESALGLRFNAGVREEASAGRSAHHADGSDGLTKSEEVAEPIRLCEGRNITVNQANILMHPSKEDVINMQQEKNNDSLTSFEVPAQQLNNSSRQKSAGGTFDYCESSSDNVPTNSPPYNFQTVKKHLKRLCDELGVHNATIINVNRLAKCTLIGENTSILQIKIKEDEYLKHFKITVEEHPGEKFQLLSIGALFRTTGLLASCNLLMKDSCQHCFHAVLPAHSFLHEKHFDKQLNLSCFKGQEYQVYFQLPTGESYKITSAPIFVFYQYKESEFKAVVDIASVKVSQRMAFNENGVPICAPQILLVDEKALEYMMSMSVEVFLKSSNTTGYVVQLEDLSDVDNGLIWVKFQHPVLSPGDCGTILYVRDKCNNEYMLSMLRSGLKAKPCYGTVVLSFNLEELRKEMGVERLIGLCDEEIFVPCHQELLHSLKVFNFNEPMEE